MTISEQIKVLCMRSSISVSELARLMGKSSQSFSAEMKRESFTVKELGMAAKAVNAKYMRQFELPSGEKI